MRSTQRILQSLLLPIISGILVALLAACGTPDRTATGSTQPTAPHAPAMPQLPPLGTEWLLLSYGPPNAPKQPLPDARVTALFSAEGEFGGTTGCNHYGAKYTLEGGTFRITEVSQTAMACEPPAVMEQELAFTNALASAKAIMIAGDRLEIAYRDGVLRFMLLPPVPDATFVGTPWQLTGFQQGEGVASLIVGTQIGATFTADGAIRGESGCNSYQGAYKLEGQSLTISGLARTERACEDSLVRQQEQLYLTALAAATTYRIDGAQLTIQHPGGALFFTAKSALATPTPLPTWTPDPFATAVINTPTAIASTPAPNATSIGGVTPNDLQPSPTSILDLLTPTAIPASPTEART